MDFRKIVVPLDFSSVTEPAVRQAFDLARVLGASVALLTVIDDSFPYPEIFSIDTPNDDFYRTLRDKALAAMKELVAKHGAGLAVESVVTRGRPATSIVEFAAKEGAGMIVMSTHGATGLQHALIGSVTERVVQKAACAVLVLRAKPA